MTGKSTKECRIDMRWSYFDGSDYETKSTEGHGFMSWLLRDNWCYFLVKYGGIVLRTRRLAIKNIYDKKAWSDSSIDIFRLIERTGGRFFITGMDNIAKVNEPVIYISNHISTLETMIFPCLIAPHHDVTFVVKDSLVRHPLFGPIMRSREPIIVGRSEPRKDFEIVMNRGKEILAGGTSIVVFPQSTRSNIFKPEEFNSIGVKLARTAGVKIIPVAIKTDFWGNGRIIKEIGPLHHARPIMMKFGEAFPVTGNGREENQRIVDFITTNLVAWGGKVSQTQ